MMWPHDGSGEQTDTKVRKISPTSAFPNEKHLPRLRLSTELHQIRKPSGGEN